MIGFLVPALSSARRTAGEAPDARRDARAPDCLRKVRRGMGTPGEGRLYGERALRRAWKAPPGICNRSERRILAGGVQTSFLSVSPCPPSAEAHQILCASAAPRAMPIAVRSLPRTQADHLCCDPPPPLSS